MSWRRRWLTPALLLAALALAPVARAQDQDDAAARFDRLSELGEGGAPPAAPGLQGPPSRGAGADPGNLERWRALPPEERSRVTRNLQAFQRLSPAEQQRLRSPVPGVPEALPRAAPAPAPEDEGVPGRQSRSPRPDDGEPPSVEVAEQGAAGAVAAAAPRAPGEAQAVTGLPLVLLLLATGSPEQTAERRRAWPGRFRLPSAARRTRRSSGIWSCWSTWPRARPWICLLELDPDSRKRGRARPTANEQHASGSVRDPDGHLARALQGVPRPRADLLRRRLRHPPRHAAAGGRPARLAHPRRVRPGLRRRPGGARSEHGHVRVDRLQGGWTSPARWRPSSASTPGRWR